MTFLGRLLSFYSTLIMVLCLGIVLWFGWRPSPVQPVVLLLVLYIVPPSTFRVYRLFFPARKSVANLTERKYVPWWGAHQIQVMYIAVPQLEALLRLVPGLYSAWLRLWGAKIGRSVYWTPNVEILDRQVLDVGDRVICGHCCRFLSHVIKPRGRDMLLYSAPIKIGSDVFIGAGSRIGPGAVVEDGIFLPVMTDVHINEVVKKPPCSEQQVTV